MTKQKSSIFRYVEDFVFITLGVFSAAFGLKSFLLTNHFIDGGATGISLLISALTKIPLSILLTLVNIQFIFLGYKIMGKFFVLKTCSAIAGLALVVGTVTFPNITNDNLLVAIFGGFFLGSGIGLAVRGGAVIDGTEVLGIFLSRKFGTSIGDIIIVINVIIFSVAAYFLSLEITVYSLITYLTASKTLDFIVDGIGEYMGVAVVSLKIYEIANMIKDDIDWGVSVYEGKNGFGRKSEMKILTSFIQW